MRALRREPTEHFKMTYINDDKDYSIPLEERETNHLETDEDSPIEENEPSNHNDNGKTMIKIPKQR